MKRPHGFDRQSARPPVPTARAAAGAKRAAARADRSVTGDQVAPDASAADPITEPVPISTALLDRPGESAKAFDAPAESQERAPSVARAARERRRYERNEVKRFTRRSRRRRAIWIGSAATVVAVLAVTVLAAFSPLMALRTIDVVGTTRIDASAVRASLTSQLGKPLPLIDYGSIRHALDGYRLIRSYSTEAVPPGTLVVRVVERTPIGLLSSSTGYDLVDQAGVVISSTPQKPGGYPVITTSGAPGSPAAKRSFTAAADVLAVLPPSLLPRVTAITATSGDDVTFTLGGKKVVWGGPADADLKSTVLTALLKAAPWASSYDVSSPQAPVTR
jgi:Cell division septal protein